MKKTWSTMALMMAMVFVGTVGLVSRTSFASSSGVVNINAASVQQLQFLKGIGAQKAKAIVEFRSNTPFRSVNDLAKVKGIGKKLVNSLRPQLRIKGETTLKRPKRTKTKHTKKKS